VITLPSLKDRIICGTEERNGWEKIARFTRKGNVPLSSVNIKANGAGGVGNRIVDHCQNRFYSIKLKGA